METDSVIQQMKEIAPNYKIEKLVLFESRARGTTHSSAIMILQSLEIYLLWIRHNSGLM